MEVNWEIFGKNESKINNVVPNYCMSFIRRKAIPAPSGKIYSYFYMVENHREGKRVVQKVVKYIGKNLPKPPKKGRKG